MYLLITEVLKQKLSAFGYCLSLPQYQHQRQPMLSVLIAVLTTELPNGAHISIVPRMRLDVGLISIRSLTFCSSSSWLLPFDASWFYVMVWTMLSTSISKVPADLVVMFICWCWCWCVCIRGRITEPIEPCGFYFISWFSYLFALWICRRRFHLNREPWTIFARMETIERASLTLGDEHSKSLSDICLHLEQP